MAGIRVKSNVIKIEVNDKGDTIVLRKSMDFFNAFLAFTQGMERMQEDYNKKLEEINPNDTEALCELAYNLHKGMHDGLELLFGEGTCKKVFGDGEVDVIPTIDAVMDFISQVYPYILSVLNELKSVSDKVEANNVKEFPQKPKGYMGKAPETDYFGSLRKQLSDFSVGSDQ